MGDVRWSDVKRTAASEIGYTEGNHDDKVASVTRKISDMAGFGRPWYTAEKDPDKEVNITIKVNAPEGVKVNIKVE